MRVLYVSLSKIPSRSANSIHVMKMCQAFADNGCGVSLLLPNRSEEVTKNRLDIYEFYGINKKFNIIRLPWFPVKGRALIFGLFSALRAKKNNTDLVYGRDINSCFFCTLFRIPVIFESHQPIAESGKHYELLFKVMLKNHNLKKFVVISSALKEYYQNRYEISEDRVLVAHDAADIISNVEKVDFHSQGQMQVGYTGHLYPGKGMEIIAELIKRCPWAFFHVVGGSSKDLDMWKSKLGLYKNAFFHGFIPHKEVVKYTASFDILLAPYQRIVLTSGGGDIAGWMSPLKIFEYMAAGKPIICSDLPVLHEILEHKVDAILCNPAEVKCWVDALESLRDDEALRKKLANNAKRKFTNNYTWKKRAKKILECID